MLMKKKTIIFYLFLFAASLFLLAYSGSSPKEKPPLQLELVLQKHRFEAGEPIACTAQLTYVGDEDAVKVYLTNPVVIFTVDGGEYYHGDHYWWAAHDIQNEPAITRILKKGEPIEFPFQKQQHWFSAFDGVLDDEEKAFWENYKSTPDLTLEPGRYKIYARCGYSLKYATAHGPFEEITVSETIVVK